MTHVRNHAGRPAATVERANGDGGAIVAELALVLPLLVMLVLGIFEFGMGWRESLNITSANRAAARQVSNLGDARSADFYGLQAFRAGLASGKNLTVDRVVIYKATNANGTPSNASCLTTSASASGTGITGACNIYSANQINNLGTWYLTNFGTSDTACATTAWDRYWCPVGRNADQGDPPDYVGVYARVQYDSVSNMLPDTIIMKDKAVMRIEPRV